MLEREKQTSGKIKVKSSNALVDSERRLIESERDKKLNSNYNSNFMRGFILGGLVFGGV